MKNIVRLGQLEDVKIIEKACRSNDESEDIAGLVLVTLKCDDKNLIYPYFGDVHEREIDKRRGHYIHFSQRVKGFYGDVDQELYDTTDLLGGFHYKIIDLRKAKAELLLGRNNIVLDRKTGLVLKSRNGAD